jgi:hypothetical protein
LMQNHLLAISMSSLWQSFTQSIWSWDYSWMS